MTIISNSTVIRCTPEEAFDYLSDHRSELEWNPGIESIEKLTDGPVGLGTKYLAKWKSAPQSVEVETVRYDRPHGWTVHNGGLLEVTVTIRLEPVAQGTRLHSDFDARPHGWFRPVFPLFLAKIRKEESANMTYLREALERRATRSSDWEGTH
jgi:carbon monoxide dehydrogenase subunit G